MINLADLKPGSKIETRDGLKGIVTENMNDGQWVEAEMDNDQGNPVLIHSQEIVAVLDDTN